MGPERIPVFRRLPLSGSGHSAPVRFGEAVVDRVLPQVVMRPLS